MQKKQTFKLPYIGIDHYQDFDFLYGLQGEISVVLQIKNPILQFSGNINQYHEYHHVFQNLLKILGKNHILQKQDVLFRKPLKFSPAKEYLQQKYNEHFSGRMSMKIKTYLTITKVEAKGYTAKQFLEFRQLIGKVFDVLENNGFCPAVMREVQINELVKRLITMEFKSEEIAMDNLLPSATEISIGSRSVKNISLVDVDVVDLPGTVSCYAEMNDREALKGFPIDLLSLLYKIPDCDTVVFNQVILIPDQPLTLKKLELKKKRHSGIPDQANLVCMEDIDTLLTDVARDSQLLVHAHFNIIIAADREKIQRAANFVESALFQIGIIPSRNAYNQFELFCGALPGNSVALKSYDLFLTTGDAALCFLFKESLPADEPSDFLLRFTDRQGTPVGIDLSDYPLRTGRITARNRFVLGSSGSGKSYCLCSVIEQYLLYNMDVVIIDVGHSYSGLSSYLGAKYITWSDQNPITMNPFSISESEYNIEKKDFLVTLISLLWVGADGTISNVARDVISNVLSSYYSCYYAGRRGISAEHRVDELSFNSFYEYALCKIPEIKAQENIPFDLDEFKFVLKKYYKDGEFEAILNEPADDSLFNERLVIFEIDAVKEIKSLFPIVTLIIMDLFLQKMRYRKDQRKALIIEEAWKAIASPLMAGNILYFYKTVRKFWGEIIVVTQELSDIIGNPVIKDSILSNSDTVFLLDQSKFRDNYKDVAQLLSISETEQRKIFSINQLDNKQGRGAFKEVYIRRGQVGEVYGIEVSLAQYLTYTTEKPEKMAVEIYLQAYGDYPSALDCMISDLEKSSLKLNEFVRRINDAGCPMLSA